MSIFVDTRDIDITIIPPDTKLRTRDVIPTFGRGDPGLLNSITDVPGVQIGYAHIHDGPVHTGVTAILPRGKAKLGVPCAAGVFSLNGNGEMTGTIWLEEAGALASPIALTNTLAIGTVHRAVVDWMLEQSASVDVEWQLPVVAETWDGYLNDIKGHHVTKELVYEAFNNAVSDVPIMEGSVGGGAGMNSFGYKAGSGTSSRVVTYAGKEYIVGVFVQSNFGRRRELTINGTYLGEVLKDDNPMMTAFLPISHIPTEGSGSIIVIVATNAPLLPGQLKAMARRCSMGIARTGSTSGHFSGDIFLAFSTANEGCLTSKYDDQDELEKIEFIPWGRMDRFFEATAMGTEEAIMNSLFAADAIIGINDHRSPALPIEIVLDAINKK